MTRYLIGSALGALLLLAAAPARAESEWVKVFDVEGDPRPGKAEVGGVAKQCDFHMMSRMGPDPREVAACDAAVKRLAARGATAVPAILAALDRDDVPHAARVRLYAALAESGDPAVAGRMIDAMAKVATSRSAPRSYETGHMEDVAEAILHVRPEERAAWVPEPRTDEFVQLTERVFAWRGHQRATAGKTSEELAAARLAQARADKASPDLEKAFLAVRYLIQRDPAEARAAADVLIGRSSEATPDQRDAVRRSFEMLKRQAEYQERQRAEEAAAKARGPAKGKTGGKPAPPAAKKAPAKSDPASRS